MKPSTIIDILKAKLYLGNVRRKDVTYAAIKLQEEYLKVEAGREINIPYDPQEQYWQKLWIDEVNDVFFERNIRLYDHDARILKITSNETIMDMARRYVQVKHMDVKVLGVINLVRKKKKVYLPCELVGMNGKTPTQCYIKLHEQSQLKWSFSSEIEEPITRHQIKIWESFIQWLVTIPIQTIRDFSPKDWRWKITDDRRFLRVEDEANKTVHWYKLRMDESGIYGEIKKQMILDVSK